MPMSTCRAAAYLAACLSLATASASYAAVKVPRVFSSHMVLQRGVPVPIWGTADAGEQVTVAFAGQSKSAKADAQGNWLVKLDSLSTGEPATLTISGSNTITLTDVLVGEVWVGSGQSNIDSPVQMYIKDDSVLAQAITQKIPRLRRFHSEQGNGWQETTPATVKQFSAQLFYFGLMLEKQLDCPVGVMEGAVQGSPAARWITDEVVQADPGIQAAIEDHKKRNPLNPEADKQYEQALAAWEKKVAELPPDTPKNKLPPKPWKSPPAGFTNGERGSYYIKYIKPIQPFAIRGVLWDQGEGGTNIYGVDQNIVMNALIKSWRADWGQGELPWIYVQKPSGGGIALNPEDPITKGADAPKPLPKAPVQAARGAISRTQYIRITTDTPKTFMVTTQDLVAGVHPINKSGYATRAANVALGAVYGKPIEYQGPTYQSCKAEGGKLRLTFTHTGQGLTVPAGQKLQGFAIAGDDKKFYWADAEIEGQTLVLSSPQVAAPVAARYAWAADIAWANLFNKDGLPAVTFRTDDW